MANFWRAVNMGIYAFKKSFFDSSDAETWSDFKARKSRYAIYWAYLDNTVYDNIHSWANALKNRYGLYKSVRNIASPAGVIAAHFRDHVWGGALSNKAEDTGAVPIYTEDEYIREMIADVWKWSQWGRNKNLLVMKGSVYGDIGLRVVDDIKHKRVYLEIVDPNLVKEVELDPFGNVKSYTLEHERTHPNKLSMTVTYREEVSREGEFVVYKTYLNDSPHAYPDNIDRTGTPREEWKEAYGFVPFVWINHVSTGDVYGWSEFYPGLSKFREIDDQVSLLSDQIRKTIQPIWLIKGVKPSNITLPSSASTTQRPEPWKEEQNMIFANNQDVEIEAMVAKLDIKGALEHIEQLNIALEKEYPELVLHRLRTAGNVVSGRALRIAQQPAESKVVERRNNYDGALKNALQMCMSIGGMRGIYPGIDLNSYGKGDLEFEISEREVFALDPEDEASLTYKFYQSAKLAFEVGIPVEGFLRSQGKTEEEIKEIMTPTEGVVIQKEVNVKRKDEV